MRRSRFKIDKMDCAAEEQMVRLRLAGVKEVRSLEFDLGARTVDVHHEGGPEAIAESLEGLGLGSELVSSETAGDVPAESDHREQRTLLRQVLAINFFFFGLELLTGFISESMGLVADSLDMLADSIVYGLALLAVGGAAARKKNIAAASGYFQLALAVLGLFEVVRRFLGYGDMPEFGTMIVISALALAGNSISLYLLQKSRSEEAHMRASMIFTANDVIINIGVIAAGVLVYLLDSRFPDLVVGAVIFVIVARGAVRILRLSKE